MESGEGSKKRKLTMSRKSESLDLPSLECKAEVSIYLSIYPAMLFKVAIKVVERWRA